MPERFSIGDDSGGVGTEGTVWFKFDNMAGTIPEVQQRIERITYPGINYARYRRTGKGGRDPFSINTVRYVVDLDAGRTLLTSYATLVGSGIQTLIWEDHDFDTHTLGVVVIGVDLVSLRNVGCVVGSYDDTNNTARLEASWNVEFRDR